MLDAICSQIYPFLYSQLHNWSDSAPSTLFDRVESTLVAVAGENYLLGGVAMPPKKYDAL
jgi:hypothetical protein